MQLTENKIVNFVEIVFYKKIYCSFYEPNLLFIFHLLLYRSKN